MTAHVSKNTGDMEWITPLRIVNAARHIMGAIDLDPASSHEAQRLVKAGAYFTKDHNGLEHDWSGRVWLNPPYKAGLVSKFVDKLIAEMQACRVTQAIMLTNNATETKWAQRLVESRMVHCIALLKGRVRFLHFDENNVLVPKLNPLQGQVLWGLCINTELFRLTVNEEKLGKSFEYVG